MDCLEALLRLLIDKSPDEILELYQENQVLNRTVTKVLKMFTLKEDHQSLKALEVQLDCLEFLLSTLPEALYPSLGEIIVMLLTVSTKVKKKDL